MVYLVEERVVELLKKNNATITTMESCTSGLLISTITDIEGASSITHGGYVSYSNEAKIECGVPSIIINKFGVYSDKTAISMASTCKAKKGATIGIGVTGTFSNVDPNNSDSISGEVYYCINYSNGMFVEKIKLPKNFSSNIYIPVRRLQKEFVINHILNKLEEILKDMYIW